MSEEDGFGFDPDELTLEVEADMREFADAVEAAARALEELQVEIDARGVSDPDAIEDATKRGLADGLDFSADSDEA